MQRALMQLFKAENYFIVREALIAAARGDLINRCNCLISARPLEARHKQANDAVRGDHYHPVANLAKGDKPGERGAEPPKLTGYRSGRTTR